MAPILRAIHASVGLGRLRIRQKLSGQLIQRLFGPRLLPYQFVRPEELG